MKITLRADIRVGKAKARPAERELEGQDVPQIGASVVVGLHFKYGQLAKVKDVWWGQDLTEVIVFLDDVALTDEQWSFRGNWGFV